MRTHAPIYNIIYCKCERWFGHIDRNLVVKGIKERDEDLREENAQKMICYKLDMN